MKDHSNIRSQSKGNSQAKPNGLTTEAPRNHFYALKARGKQEISLDIVTRML